MQISALRSEFQAHIAQANREVAELRTIASNNEVLLRSLCQQSGINLPALHLCTPLAPFSLQLTPEDHTATTPSASSVISNTSSIPSGVQLGNLTIDSPTTGTAGSPVAGPSGLAQEHSPVQGTSVYVIDHIFANSVTSTWSDAS